MLGAQVGGTSLSKLMGWANAVEACNQIWDAFEEAFRVEIDRRIQEAQAEYENFSAFDELPTNPGPRLAALAKVEGLQACKVQVPQTFRAWREDELGRMESALLKQSRKRKSGEVYSRRASSQLVKQPSARRRPRSTKKPHTRTGRPRGRPVSALFSPGAQRKRREKARLERRQFRAQHRANNLVRALRGLRPYPFRRAAKVDGWMAVYRDGRINKGYRGGYQHAAKRTGQQ